MTNSHSLTAKSKYLSYLLRHNPSEAGLKLDKNGWCSIENLLANTDFTFNEICEIVSTDAKKRYSFDDPNPIRATAIRANQGHTTKTVDLSFRKQLPPPVLYHGTTVEAHAKIKNEGLKSMSRHYVHLSHELETAKDVANRRKTDIVVLSVDAKRMSEDGIDFFRSDNGVWLVRAVDAKYLSPEL